jgi:hypothetical protein
MKRPLVATITMLAPVERGGAIRRLLAGIVVVLAVVVAVFAAARPASADVAPRTVILFGNTLAMLKQSQNSVLQPDFRYCSPNRKACLVYQSDGNLVVYDENNWARFATNTNGRGNRALFQADGNLVVYGSSGAIWASGTSTRRVSSLRMQPDGNVVIYATYSNGQLCCVPIWATNTNH